MRLYGIHYVVETSSFSFLHVGNQFWTSSMQASSLALGSTVWLFQCQPCCLGAVPGTLLPIDPYLPSAESHEASRKLLYPRKWLTKIVAPGILSFFQEVSGYCNRPKLMWPMCGQWTYTFAISLILILRIPRNFFLFLRLWVCTHTDTHTHTDILNRLSVTYSMSKWSSCVEQNCNLGQMLSKELVKWLWTCPL